jgi:hypothetical protein
MKAIAENGGTDQEFGQSRRLTRALLERDPIDAAHLASIPIDHLLVEQIADNVHISLRRFRAE